MFFDLIVDSSVFIDCAINSPILTGDSVIPDASVGAFASLRRSGGIYEIDIVAIIYVLNSKNTLIQFYKSSRFLRAYVHNPKFYETGV